MLIPNFLIYSPFPFSHLIVTTPLQSWLNHPLFTERDTEAQRGYVRELAKEARVQIWVCLLPKVCALPTGSWENFQGPGFVGKETEAGRSTWCDHSHQQTVCKKELGSCLDLLSSYPEEPRGERGWPGETGATRVAYRVLGAWALEPGCMCLDSGSITSQVRVLVPVT